MLAHEIIVNRRLVTSHKPDRHSHFRAHGEQNLRTLVKFAAPMSAEVDRRSRWHSHPPSLQPRCSTRLQAALFAPLHVNLRRLQEVGRRQTMFDNSEDEGSQDRAWSRWSVACGRPKFCNGSLRHFERSEGIPTSRHRAFNASGR